MLDEELQWPKTQYRLSVKDGVATIAIANRSPGRRAEAIDALSELTELKGLKIVIANPKELEAGYQPERKLTLRERLLVGIGASPEHVALPEGDPFAPLIADPKQPQFSMSVLSRHGSNDEANSQLSVGFGEEFGLYRRPGNDEQGTWQIGILGGLFGQFGLNGSQDGLINHDFTIGIPLEYQKARWSWRTRLYHQSSHLGDEFLLQNKKKKRYDFNFESLEILPAYEFPRGRVYFGGEYLIDVWPFDIDRTLLHTGIEHRAISSWFNSGRWVGGLDVKAWQEHKWQPDVSLKYGLEFGERNADQRQLRIMLEGYYGYAPYGQFFYEDRIWSVGTGVYFGF